MLRRPLILAVDQGTTNTKAALLDGMDVVASASRPVKIAFPQAGWVEQDPAEIWSSVRAVIADCLERAPASEVVALGITNQRESALVWDRKTGEPAGPCIVWQCRRTEAHCAAIRERGLNQVIQQRSGLGIDPLFSASKFRWLLAHADRGWARARGGELCAGTVDTWLLWHLTGGKVHATDATNASRTQLLNLRSLQWDEELLDIFEIPPACLPQVRPSSGIFGRTAATTALPADTPVAAMIGDSHAALFGHGAFTPGAVKSTYGTGSSLMTMTETPVESRHGLSGTIAWALPEKVSYALEGNITNSGATVQWFGDFLGRSDPAGACAEMAATVGGSQGVYLVPAFAGLGAPYWDAGARGTITGLTRATTAAHVARAALESIAFQVCDVFEAMRRDMGIAPPALLADGGASCNDALMRFQAGILGCPVLRTRTVDLSLRGCAWLAGLAVGIWSSLAEIEALPRPLDRFEPAMSAAQREAALDGWRDAVRRARSA